MCGIVLERVLLSSSQFKSGSLIDCRGMRRSRFTTTAVTVVQITQSEARGKRFWE